MIRAGVIGVGGMGKHHARVYNDLETTELVAVADPDESRRQAVARRYKVSAYTTGEEMLDRERLDVVSIAVPTAEHHAAALAAIRRDVHLLVEKPIASTIEEARDIVSQAAARGLTLMVGHVERFNPAVVELKRRLSARALGQAFQIHARRLSPFPGYIRDVGVVMDLATHELDIMRYLVGAEIQRVYAETGRKVHAQHEDMLSGLLRFENDVLGVLDINWLTPAKVREVRITGEHGMFLVDYLGQDLYFYENSGAPTEWDALAVLRDVEQGNMLKIRVTKVEPLEAELRAFVAAAETGDPPPVTGADGTWALALAKLLLVSAAEGRPVSVREEARRRGWPAIWA